VVYTSSAIGLYLYGDGRLLETLPMLLRSVKPNGQGRAEDVATGSSRRSVITENIPQRGAVGLAGVALSIACGLVGGGE
jgi:hypothetical protein